MSIDSQIVRADYTASGITGPYTFPFCSFDITQVEVITTDLTGTDTIVDPSAYVVTGVRSSTDFTEGGSLTFNDSVATGYHIAIISNETGEQPTNIKNNSEYYAELHENEFDRLALKDLQQQEQINKSIKSPDSEPAGTADLNLPSVANRASKQLGFDADGNVTVGQPSIVNVTDWTAYTPVLSWTGNLGVVSAFYRIVNDEIQVRIAIQLFGVPTPPNTPLIIGLPPNVNFDETKLPPVADTNWTLGTAFFQDDYNNTKLFQAIFNNFPSAPRFSIQKESAAGAGGVTAADVSEGGISMQASMPIKK
ncbi:MAG: hypothetical protein ACRDFB_03335 [Rhabdochlamydiaceae bacterium]